MKNKSRFVGFVEIEKQKQLYEVCAERKNNLNLGGTETIALVYIAVGNVVDKHYPIIKEEGTMMSSDRPRPKLVGIAHSKEEALDRAHKLAKKYAGYLATEHNLQLIDKVDRTKEGNLVQLAQTSTQNPR